mmetsp:Transcript_11223/g.16220  ORF Transcript_11223/g.16220 Transcript_11223/m.16220 type:complete len:111 (+) Transcript_11223:271-603(+)
MQPRPIDSDKLSAILLSDVILGGEPSARNSPMGMTFDGREEVICITLTVTFGWCARVVLCDIQLFPHPHCECFNSSLDIPHEKLVQNRLRVFSRFDHLHCFSISSQSALL